MVADMCNLDIELGNWVFPMLPIEKNKTYDEKLRELAYDGFARLNIEQSKEIIERVEYELKIILDKGYAPYFLVVGDLLKYAKRKWYLDNYPRFCRWFYGHLSFRNYKCRSNRIQTPL